MNAAYRFRPSVPVVVHFDGGSGISAVATGRRGLEMEVTAHRVLELRRRVDVAIGLGDAFDIRDFNQQVLDVASTPLPFIEDTIRTWIAASSE